MDFALTEEQQMVKEMAAKFAEAEIKPKAAELDEKHEHPADIVRQLGELKMMGLPCQRNSAAGAWIMSAMCLP